MVGLPVIRAGQGGYRRLWDEPAGMQYLRSNSLNLPPVGSLAARPGMGKDDGCRASCADWYGNAPANFSAQPRLCVEGYELGEGRLFKASGVSARLLETRRISIAPASADYQP